MKTTLARVLPILFLCVSAGIVSAGDFQSVFIQGGGTLPTITVPADRFLIIRNFTQSGGNTRGSVSVTTTSDGLMSTVLTASFVDSTAMPGLLEAINNVVIAGPSTVVVTCPDMAATCFVSYRKGSD